LEFPFGPDVTIIKVRKRIFAQVFYLKGKPMATFNCDMMTGEFYRDIYPDTVTRGYHCPPIQQPYFNTIKLDGTIPDGEIRLMIDHSYAVVTSKLPKYIQKELMEADSET
jgi:predicted DNA-binding protein (MmcQ/YjbR family)